MRQLQRSILFVALGLCVGEARAGCAKDENNVYHCSGISWTARLWIIIGAAVVFILCNILLVVLVRRHYRKKRARLPAAPGAVPYARGEYWERRRDHLPGYNPPEALLPVVAATSTPQSAMSQISSRPWVATLPPLGRMSTRTSEQPPSYEKAAAQPLIQPVGRLMHRSSDSTLAEQPAASAVPLATSIARHGPPLPSYNATGNRS